MPQAIEKPPSRESVLIFGDGDEALFGHISNSTKEGYYMVHFRPTRRMRWVKQIFSSQYESDMWIKKIYKKDLCFQLSFDPDFPVWIILCDYWGNEDTPLFKFFSNYTLNCPHCNEQIFTHLGVESLLLKNRDLDKQIKNLRVGINMSRIEESRKKNFPDEWLEDKFAVAKKSKELGEPIIIDRTGQQNQENIEDN